MVAGERVRVRPANEDSLSIAVVPPLSSSTRISDLDEYITDERLALTTGTSATTEPPTHTSEYISGNTLYYQGPRFVDARGDITN